MTSCSACVESVRHRRSHLTRSRRALRRNMWRLCTRQNANTCRAGLHTRSCGCSGRDCDLRHRERRDSGPWRHALCTPPVLAPTWWSTQRGACIRCILYTAVVMYTSTSPPLPTLSDVYVYVLYTYTKICPHVCTMYAFYTAEIHQKQGIFLMYATENDVHIIGIGIGRNSPQR